MSGAEQRSARSLPDQLSAEERQFVGLVAGRETDEWFELQLLCSDILAWLEWPWETGRLKTVSRSQRRILAQIWTDPRPGHWRTALEASDYWESCFPTGDDQGAVFSLVDGLFEEPGNSSLGPEQRALLKDFELAVLDAARAHPGVAVRCEDGRWEVHVERPYKHLRLTS